MSVAMGLEWADSVVRFSPIEGDRVRVGRLGVFVEAPAEDLGLTVGVTMRLEFRVGDVVVTPLVLISGVDEDWFTASYEQLSPADARAIARYCTGRLSR